VAGWAWRRASSHARTLARLLGRSLIRQHIAELAPCSGGGFPCPARKSSLFAKLGKFGRKPLIRRGSPCLIRRTDRAICGFRCISGRREFGAADAGRRGTDRAGLIDVLLPGTVTVFTADGRFQKCLTTFAAPLSTSRACRAGT
jgi:hypothetical protein